VRSCSLKPKIGRCTYLTQQAQVMAEGEGKEVGRTCCCKEQSVAWVPQM
jgi:hypothetical protein